MQPHHLHFPSSWSSSSRRMAPLSRPMKHIRFYIHEKNLGTANDPRWSSTRARGAAVGSGNIIVFDNVIREGADPASQAIGREQGVGVGSSLAQDSGLTVLEQVFTAGRYFPLRVRVDKGVGRGGGEQHRRRHLAVPICEVVRLGKGRRWHQGNARLGARRLCTASWSEGLAKLISY